VEREIKMALGYKEDLSVRIENIKSIVQSEEGRALLDRAEKFVIDSTLVDNLEPQTSEELKELAKVARKHIRKTGRRGR
jgi:D-alanine-D-alanine ligase-like ATP-grasp enzyme